MAREPAVLAYAIHASTSLADTADSGSCSRTLAKFRSSAPNLVMYFGLRPAVCFEARHSATALPTVTDVEPVLASFGSDSRTRDRLRPSAVISRKKRSSSVCCSGSRASHASPDSRCWRRRSAR